MISFVLRYYLPWEFAEVCLERLEEPLPVEVRLGSLGVVGQGGASGKAVTLPLFIFLVGNFCTDLLQKQLALS